MNNKIFYHIVNGDNELFSKKEVLFYWILCIAMVLLLAYNVIYAVDISIADYAGLVGLIIGFTAIHLQCLKYKKEYHRLVKKINGEWNGL